MKKLKYFFIFLGLIIFILWFKVAVDNWNKDAVEYNKRMKEYCPCGKWHYVTKGRYDCDCPTK